MNDVTKFLKATGDSILPRILTQICRDPGSPSFGACDRNWWHYKIRDFPSIILQQAGYTVALVTANSPDKEALHHIAQASAAFWNSRAIKHGAFEEYYPFEQGYPPLAFSTLAVAKLCHQGIVPLPEIRSGLEISAKQLLARFEAQAANQQIAGTAALAVIRTLDPSLVAEEPFQKILSDTLALQHPEGWFPEYDGPDLGYLSVSIDCLWDIFDHTGDTRPISAIRLAADYIAWFALSPLGTAGMHNSRNTDYFVPYGLVRLAIEHNNATAAATVEKLFTRPSRKNIHNSQSSIVNHQSPPFHPFDAVDDRYWCHYIGHSVFRAINLLEQNSALPEETGATANTSPSKPGSGHALLKSSGNATALVSTRKGAITSAIWPGQEIAHDFGWLVEKDGKLWVTHWWSMDWKTSTDATFASCEGYLVPHKEHISTPLKHMILRGGSFILGRYLIRFLKRLVIFKKTNSRLRFSREVQWDQESLVIEDTIHGTSPSDLITRAPRTSKRHVASADSYHPEDTSLLRGTILDETKSSTESSFICKTRYSVGH
ncbi:MAG: hypothetical protein ACSHX9_05255 [Luteolibacter sp.]